MALSCFLDGSVRLLREIISVEGFSDRKMKVMMPAVNGVDARNWKMDGGY
jgi:hypothetical protein